MTRAWAFGLLLAGCGTAGVEAPDAGAGRDAGGSTERCEDGDRDGDGWGSATRCARPDCDETNRAIHPDAYEACNGLDEDCDGTLDEDLGERLCTDATCTFRIPACAGGRPAVCPPPDPLRMCSPGTDAGPPPPPPPACTPQAEGVGTTYTEMRAHHPPCDGTGQRIGPDCNAAIHRYCLARECPTSGWGPVENTGDNLSVACVAADPDVNVPFAVLATHHDGCNGTSMRIGDNCNSAIHRWCISMGYVSGFGPVETGAEHAVVTCLRAEEAEVVSTTYTALSAHHGPCNGTGEAIGPNCNAAIHRFCGSLGHVSGYGPVEHGGDGALVVCLRP